MVKSARKLIGATNPLEAEAGTIRGDLAVQTGRNVVHGSDSPENGEREAGQPLFRVHTVPPYTWDFPAVHASNLSALQTCVILSKCMVCCLTNCCVSVQLSGLGRTVLRCSGSPAWPDGSQNELFHGPPLT